MMGGIWSLSRLTTERILRADLWSMLSMALRTFARSIISHGFNQHHQPTNIPPTTQHQGSERKGKGKEGKRRKKLTRLRPRRSNRNIQRPNLPTNLLLPTLPRQRTKPKPGPSALLLVEFNRDAPTDSSPADPATGGTGTGTGTGVTGGGISCRCCRGCIYIGVCVGVGVGVGIGRRGRRKMLPHKGRHARVNQGLQIGVRDGGEG